MGYDTLFWLVGKFNGVKPFKYRALPNTFGWHLAVNENTSTHMFQTSVLKGMCLHFYR